MHPITFFYVAGGGPSPLTALTYKGRGFNGTGATHTASLPLSYGTVSNGSAPSAGDVVVWNIFSEDSSADPFQALAGWEIALSNPASTRYFGAYAKVLTAGDISSPPNAVVGPTDGAGGFWVAFTPTGTVATLTLDLQTAWGGASAPSNIVVSGSSQVGPLVIVGMGFGNDGSPTHVWGGATEDGSSDSITLFGSSGVDIRAKYKYYASGSGNNVTMSKSDDGGNQGHSGLYLKLT